MRVGILCLMQESNTFLNQQTKLHHFAEDLLLVGEEIRKQLANTHHEVAGFFAGLEKPPELSFTDGSVTVKSNETKLT